MIWVGRSGHTAMKIDIRVDSMSCMKTPKIIACCSYRFPYLYPSQTKILEGGTKDDIRIFEALF